MCLYIQLHTPDSSNMLSEYPKTAVTVTLCLTSAINCYILYFLELKYVFWRGAGGRGTVFWFWQTEVVAMETEEFGPL